MCVWPPCLSGREKTSELCDVRTLWRQAWPVSLVLTDAGVACREEISDVTKLLWRWIACRAVLSDVTKRLWRLFGLPYGAFWRHETNMTLASFLYSAFWRHEMVYDVDDLLYDAFWRHEIIAADPVDVICDRQVFGDVDIDTLMTFGQLWKRTCSCLTSCWWRKVSRVVTDINKLQSAVLRGHSIWRLTHFAGFVLSVKFSFKTGTKRVHHIYLVYTHVHVVNEIAIHLFEKTLNTECLRVDIYTYYFVVFCQHGFTLMWMYMYVLCLCDFVFVCEHNAWLRFWSLVFFWGGAKLIEKK